MITVESTAWFLLCYFSLFLFVFVVAFAFDFSYSRTGRWQLGANHLANACTMYYEWKQLCEAKRKYCTRSPAVVRSTERYVHVALRALSKSIEIPFWSSLLCGLLLTCGSTDRLTVTCPASSTSSYSTQTTLFTFIRFKRINQAKKKIALSHADNSDNLTESLKMLIHLIIIALNIIIFSIDR